MGVCVKKIGVVCFIVSFLTIPAQAAGAAIAAALAPIILPLAADIAAKSAAEVRGAIRSLTSQDSQCSKLCDLTSKLTCGTKKGLSFCKSRCQKIIKVGAGYTLKIRYTDKWSLQKCVALSTPKLASPKGKSATQLPPAPKPNCADMASKSIAIYGQADYDFAMKFISKLVALDEFILNEGNIDQAKGKTPEEIETLLVKAKEDREKLSKDLQDYVQKNFGPQ